MNILTRDGYKDIETCQVGEEVLYYDLYSGNASYNNIISIEHKLPTDFPDITNDIYGLVDVEKEIFNQETGLNEKIIVQEEQVISQEIILVDRNWYVINEQFTLFSLESIWVNLNVKHAKDLVIGDIIYDDDDNDIEIISIRSYEDNNKIWHRLRITNDCSFISDSLTLHNASRFWVGGSNTWNTATTCWSASSGGGSGASVPTSADDATFDNLSYTTDYTVTMSVAKSCNTISMSAPSSGNITMSGNYDIQVYGNAILYSGLLGSRYFNFKATSGSQTFNPNGATIGTFSITGASTVNLSNSVICGNFVFTSGSFDLQNYDMSCSQFTANTSAANLILGTSTLTASSNVNISGNSLNISQGTSTINLTGTNPTLTLKTAGITLYNINFTGSGNPTITNGTLTCNNLTRTGTAVKTGGLSLASNVTVNGVLTLNGNSSINRLLIYSSVLGTARTITSASNSISNSDFRDITGAGAGSWNLSAISGLSGDCGGNTNITFTSPTTTTCSAGTTWDTATWSVRVPLPQDTANFSGSSRTITQTMPRVGSVDFTGSSSISYTIAISLEIYGSLNFTNLNTYNQGAYGLHFLKTGTTYLNTNSKTLSTIYNATTLEIQTDITSSGYFYSGSSLYSNSARAITLNTNNFNMSFGTYDFYTTTNVTLNLGSSLLTITAAVAVAFNYGGVTLNAGTSTIKYTSNSASARSFNGGGKTFYKLWNATLGTGTFTISGSNTFNEIMTDVGRTTTFTAGTTQTIGNLTINGTGSVTTFKSSTATNATLSKASGNILVDNCTITDLTATGGATFTATNSTITDSPGWVSGLLANPVFIHALMNFM